jgi:hypothetical protein
MLMKHRLDVGRNAAGKSVLCLEMNLSEMRNEKMWNRYVKKKNVANSSVKNSSVKKRAPNAQVLSVNGPHDALTHSMSRRAYY